MRFPWRSLQTGPRRWWSHAPSAAHALIGAHVGLFVAQTVSESALPDNVVSPLETWGALTGETLQAGQLWRLGTHLFLHDGALSLLASALLLLFAGRNLEAILGRRHFLALYFLAGIAAGLVQAAGTLLPDAGPGAAVQPIVGDLGAALAVLLAFTTIMPELELGALIFLPAPSVRLKARYVAGVALVAMVLLFVIYSVAPATTPVGDVDGALRLACLGALVGTSIGWLYARTLGFGRRWPLNAVPVAHRTRTPRSGKLVAPGAGKLAAAGGGKVDRAGCRQHRRATAGEREPEQCHRGRGGTAGALFLRRGSGAGDSGGDDGERAGAAHDGAGIHRGSRGSDSGKDLARRPGQPDGARAPGAGNLPGENRRRGRVSDPRAGGSRRGGRERFAGKLLPVGEAAPSLP